ncbi:hypothetical protein [Streptomyces sp. NPDC005568]|uniref:hypothetical protein n=1 Tax=Streptomyces sp. NPDC005568 TaxID=3156887 RepID=UPI0033AEA9A0
MLSHTIERGVLMITPDAATDTGERTALAAHISDLVHTYQPFPVVIVLEGPATGSATVDAVVEAHRACAHLGPADHPRTDLLRHRSLIAARSLGCEEWLHTPEAVDRVLSAAADLDALLLWLVRHVKHVA